MEGLKQIKTTSYVSESGDLFFDVTYLSEDGTVMEKRVPVEVFAQMLLGNLVEKETFVTVPHLPEEVKACRISTMGSNSFDAIVVYKAQKRAMSFYGQHYYLPYPALVGVVSVRNGIKRGCEIYALPTDDPVEETPLMQYPFGNVRRDGSTCYGNILVNDIKGVSDAHKVLDAFLCGDTNDDLYHNQNTEHLSQGKLIEKLLKKETYPVELLCSVGSGSTFGGLLESLGDQGIN